MLSFSPTSPFPLLSESSFSYSDAQDHSSLVDRFLGLETEKIERDLATNGCKLRAQNSSGVRQELWIGLALKSLLTPYTEIRALLEKISPKSGWTIVDLGAGYGRMGFVIGRHFQNVNFVGYEYVGERVKEGLRVSKKMNLSNFNLIHSDLSSPDFIPVKAEVYFIYDYGAPKAIEKTLHDLRRIAKEKTITVVGRGRSSRDIIERHHPWLSQVVTPEHGLHTSIYRSGLTAG